jgi:hypothetical protein
MNNYLILRTLTSPYSDVTKGSVLSQAELDGNFIFLKGNIIYTAETNGANITLKKYNGESFTFVAGGSGIFTGGTVTGPTIFTNGATANTLTVNGVEITGDTYTIGSTLIGTTAYFDTNTALSAYTLDLSSIAGSSSFSGGTVTGPTNFTNGLTANSLTVNGVEITGDTYTTGTTLVGNVAYFNTNTALSAYTLNLSGVSSSVTYTNASPTPTTIGGISAGSTFLNKTMQEMWDMLLYPYQSPAFSSFSLGISSPKEIGFDITTSQTFTWSTTNPSNVSANTISIAGYNLTTLTGLANDGSEAVTFTAVVTRNSSDGPGTRSWSIQGTNTNNITFSTSLSIRWDWRMYAGTSTNTSLNGSQITSLTDFNSVKNGFSGTFNLSAGGYKYFCFANTYGTPSTFVDTSNNLNIAMYTGYSNIDVNGNSYDLVSVTNSEGETTNYRVYRTLNILGGSINIAVN